MEEEFKRIESSSQWGKLFDQINENSKSHPSKVGSSNANSHLNRYQDVIPYDDTLVSIKPGYINANHVTVPQAARHYLLTQGPLSTTLEHFWTMIWEHKTSLIVMLNSNFELEIDLSHCELETKCYPYWPTRTFEGVKLSVTLDKIEKNKHFNVRSMTLKDLSSGKTRKILQYHYTAWPDHDQPESPTSLLRFLAAVRKTGGLDTMNEPAVVHCSAGIGRSGTFCLIDSILCIIENQGSTEGIDIVSTLIEMRDYRKGLIQTPVQLRFAYLCIMCGVKILDQKLNPHISSSARDDGSSSKKQTRSRKQGGNLFKRKLFVDAMEEIESDEADDFIEDIMKPSPTMKRARNETPERKSELQFSLPSPGIESTLLRRREQNAKNARIAQKCRDIKEKMRSEEQKRERRSSKINFIKNSVFYGGFAVAVLGSLIYVYLHNTPPR